MRNWPSSASGCRRLAFSLRLDPDTSAPGAVGIIFLRVAAPTQRDMLRHNSAHHRLADHNRTLVMRPEHFAELGVEHRDLCDRRVRYGGWDVESAKYFQQAADDSP